ncbi:serine hydrolase [Candidatus Methylospira mobilis]|nr:serine hydrolase [Candidatus Methylospira mobilis]
MEFETALITGILAMASTPAANASRGDFQIVYQGRTVDDLVINYMQRNHIPGLSLAIVQAPYIPRVVAYGLADTSAKTLISSNTVFNVGQITNAYTAVAVMQLKEEGKLGLEDPVTKYLPNASKEWNSIKIRHLLTHSSGLPSYNEASGFDYSQDYNLDSIIDMVKKIPARFKAGHDTYNSATDFYLLGAIIEKSSGVSYQEYITKNQIERAGLKYTFFPSSLESVKNELHNGSQPFLHAEFKQNPVFINPAEPAVGYRDANNGWTAVKPNKQSATFADSGIMASAQDISIWDIALAGEILVKNPENREFLYRSVKLDNGKISPGNAGWQFPGHPGLMYIKGNIPGFSTFLSRFTAPTELLCVTLLANKDNIRDLDVLARQIAGAYDQKLAAPAGSAWVVSRESPYTVNETLDRVSKVLEAKGAKVFARIDHGANAAGAGKAMKPKQVLIVGNPAVGTDLIIAKPTVAIDLPLRIMAWEDDTGQVWASFTDPVELGKQYHIEGQEQVLNNMYQAVYAAVDKATTAY